MFKGSFRESVFSGCSQENVFRDQFLTRMVKNQFMTCSHIHLICFGIHLHNMFKNPSFRIPWTSRSGSHHMRAGSCFHLFTSRSRNHHMRACSCFHLWTSRSGSHHRRTCSCFHLWTSRSGSHHMLPSKCIMYSMSSMITMMRGSLHGQNILSYVQRELGHPCIKLQHI